MESIRAFSIFSRLENKKRVQAMLEPAFDFVVGDERLELPTPSV